ncbi:MAG: hypothetical protein IT425_03695 [Pirellulales bacterium]|nr:hypothetical protein [Pirellulales bacterium]
MAVHSSNDVHGPAMAEPIRFAQPDQLNGSSWLGVALGIIAAGGVYSILFTMAYAAFYSAVFFFAWGRGESLYLEEVIEIVGAVVVVGGIGIVAGLLWTMVVTAITLPLTHLVTRSLSLRSNLASRGAFIGGLVGFIATLPFWVIEIGGLSDFWRITLTAPLGPGIATIIGQFGGAWGARRTIRKYRRQRLPTCLREIEIQAERNHNHELARSTNVKWQFGIRHLLWIVVWLSLLLSVIRIVGIPFRFTVPILFGWTAYQAATLWLVRRLTCRWRLVRGKG